MSLGGHIDELRARLIRCIISVAIFAVIAFILKDKLINIVFAPSNPDFILNRLFAYAAEELSTPQLAINQNDINLINTKMAGQFNLHLKVSIMTAIAASMPVILWQFWLFVRPALDIDIQKRCRNMVWVVLLLFFVGLSFGYFFISPLAVNFLTNYNLSDTITNYIDVSSFISTVTTISLAAGLVFQLPVFVYLLASAGIITASGMRKSRRIAFAAIVILSAVITPPDVFSQLLIAVPLYGLYEYGIVIAKREEKKREMRINGEL